MATTAGTSRAVVSASRPAFLRPSARTPPPVLARVAVLRPHTPQAPPRPAAPRTAVATDVTDSPIPAPRWTSTQAVRAAVAVSPVPRAPALLPRPSSSGAGPAASARPWPSATAAAPRAAEALPTSRARRGREGGEADMPLSVQLRSETTLSLGVRAEGSEKVDPAEVRPQR